MAPEDLQNCIIQKVSPIVEKPKAVVKPPREQQRPEHDELPSARNQFIAVNPFPSTINNELISHGGETLRVGGGASNSPRQSHDLGQGRGAAVRAAASASGTPIRHNGQDERGSPLAFYATHSSSIPLVLQSYASPVMSPAADGSEQIDSLKDQQRYLRRFASQGSRRVIKQLHVGDVNENGANVIFSGECKPLGAAPAGTEGTLAKRSSGGVVDDAAPWPTDEGHELRNSQDESHEDDGMRVRSAVHKINTNQMMSKTGAIQVHGAIQVSMTKRSNNSFRHLVQADLSLRQSPQGEYIETKEPSPELREPFHTAGDPRTAQAMVAVATATVGRGKRASELSTQWSIAMRRRELGQSMALN